MSSATPASWRARRGSTRIVGTVILLALGGAITGFILLGDSWFQLLIAGALGIILTQVVVPHP